MCDVAGTEPTTALMPRSLRWQERQERQEWQEWQEWQELMKHMCEGGSHSVLGAGAWLPQLARTPYHGRHMVESWQLAGWWGPRVESAEECALRWLRFFRDLEPLGHELLGNWGPPAETLCEAMRDLAVEYDSLLNQVHLLDRTAGESGFSFGCWNRREGVQSVGFSAGCGSSDTAILLNRAYLTLYTESDDEVRERGRLARDLMMSLVKAWEPDWGFYVTDELRNHQYDQKHTEQHSPIAGYLTYLSAGRHIALPSNVPARVAATPDGGVVLSLVEPDGSLRKPDDVLRLAKILTESGAFAPTPKDRPTLGSQPGGGPGPGIQPVGSAASKPAPNVIELNLKYEAIPENARAFAADIATATLKISGVELDYSRESLRQVDAVLEELRSDGPPIDQFRETLFGFGCYIGEVMVRHANGRWDIPRSTEERSFVGWPLLVRFPDGRCANPIHKVMRSYEEGVEHDLGFFYDVMVGRRTK